MISSENSDVFVKEEWRRDKATSLTRLGTWQIFL